MLKSQEPPETAGLKQSERDKSVELQADPSVSVFLIAHASKVISKLANSRAFAWLVAAPLMAGIVLGFVVYVLVAVVVFGLVDGWHRIGHK